MNLGIAIKEVRKSKKISQGDLASTLDISQSYLSLIEKGKKQPSLDLLQKMSQELGVPQYYFMFKALEKDKDIPEEKRAAYDQIEAIINPLINNLFLQD